MTERDTPVDAVDDAPVLELPASIEAAIVDAARASAPAECCGVLGGEFDPNRSRVRSHYPTANAADEPRRRYLIDPEEQLAVFERLEDRGEEIVGFYHSHPRGPSGPSETDVESAAWPDRSYVIVSLEAGRDGEPIIGSWRWRDADGSGLRGDGKGRFERERLKRP